MRPLVDAPHNTARRRFQLWAWATCPIQARTLAVTPPMRPFRPEPQARGAGGRRCRQIPSLSRGTGAVPLAGVRACQAPGWSVPSRTGTAETHGLESCRGSLIGSVEQRSVTRGVENACRQSARAAVHRQCLSRLSPPGRWRAEPQRESFLDQPGTDATRRAEAAVTRTARNVWTRRPSAAPSDSLCFLTFLLRPADPFLLTLLLEPRHNSWI